MVGKRKLERCKNPDLWQKLDAVCAGRNIEWNWIKGHAGHPGNEMADQLANLGADKTAKRTQATTVCHCIARYKKPEQDWLLDDPFGFDLAEATEEENIHLEITEEVEMIEVTEEIIDVETVEQESKQPTNNIHPQIVVTEAKLKLQGPRQLILDTETTGFISKMATALLRWARLR